MKANYEEQYEYKKFMSELAHKAQEVQQDFNKLSEANKAKVLSELEKVLAMRSITDVLRHINSYK